MGKTKRDTGSAVEETFHKHYAAIWGEDRWRELYPALEEKTRYTALVNRYSPKSGFDACFADAHEREKLEQLRLPIVRAKDSQDPDSILCFTYHLEKTDQESNSSTQQTLPQPKLGGPDGSTQRLMTHWNLDAASVLVAHLLNVRPNDNVLDLCAAPGGKSIALAQALWPTHHQGNVHGIAAAPLSHSGSLSSNEVDSTRSRRLTENLKAYLPSHLFASEHVSSFSIDGTQPLAARKLSIGSEGYDKVLVDAPCSSERHIIHANLTAKAAGLVAPEMANWRPGSSKRLSKMQIELLMTGLRAAKIGGSVLYATCSIEMSENDSVVEKVLALVDKEVKKGSKWSVKLGFPETCDNVQLEDELEKEWAERTKFGWIVLPDHPASGKWGPLYFAMFTKTKSP